MDKRTWCEDPLGMTQGKLFPIAFYTDGTFLEVPKDQDLFEYARKNRVNYLAINEKDIEESHPNLFGEKLRYSGNRPLYLATKSESRILSFEWRLQGENA